MSAELVAAIERLADAISTRVTEPLLVDAARLGVLLDISERQVRRLDDGGKLPAALEIGGSKKWRIAEVRSWLAAGAPSRHAWENLRSEVAEGRESEGVVVSRRH
jgi:hypothetical protein